MTKLTAAAIEGERRALKSRLDELLKCDELWNNKLTRTILDAAMEERDAHRHYVVEERLPPEQAEQENCTLLRNLIAISMLGDELMAWARKEQA